MVAGLLVWYLLYYQLRVSFNVWLSIAAVCWAIVGKALDTYSTYALFQLKPLFDELGLTLPVVETNPLHPEFPTLQELIFSWVTLLEVLAWVASFFGPPMGFFLGLAHLAAAFNNWMYRRSALSTLKGFRDSAQPLQA